MIEFSQRAFNPLFIWRYASAEHIFTNTSWKHVRTDKSNVYL